MRRRDIVERQESVAILDRAIDGLPAALRCRARDDQDALRLVRQPGRCIQDLSLNCRSTIGLGLTCDRETRKIKTSMEAGQVKRLKGHLYSDG